MRERAGPQAAAWQLVGLPAQGPRWTKTRRRPKRADRPEHDLLVGKPGDDAQRAFDRRTGDAQTGARYRHIGGERSQFDRSRPGHDVAPWKPRARKTFSK